MLFLLLLLRHADALALTGRRDVLASSLFVRGAFELDAEYYARSVLGLDKRDVFDKREPRKQPDALPSRSIDEAFATKILTSAVRCAKATNKAFDFTLPMTLTTSDDVSDAAKGFYTAAAKTFTTPQQRDAFQRCLGDALLLDLGGVPSRQSSLRAGVATVLDVWTTHGWIEKASIDGEDDLSLQVTLRRPVTATAAAQLEKLGLIWHPDFVGCSLASYLATTTKTRPQFDEYLLDDTYRTDPRAFQASSVLLLFPLDIDDD